jgi:hypothetical protein
MIKHPPTVDLTELKTEKVRSKLVQIDDLKLDDILDIDNISIITSQNLVKLDEPQPEQGTVIQNDTVIHITEDTENHILVGTNRRINSSTISTRRRIRGSRRQLPWATRTHSEVPQNPIEDDLVPGMSYDLARIQPSQDADRELNVQNESIQEGGGEENRRRGRGRGRGRASRGRRHRQVRAKLHIDSIRNESQLVICGNCGEKGHNIKDCLIRRIMPSSDHSDQSGHSDDEEYKEPLPITEREEIITHSRSLQPLSYSLFSQNFTHFALGRSLKRSRKCGFCKEEGHNARTCHYINTRFRSRSREDNNEE